METPMLFVFAAAGALLAASMHAALWRALRCECMSNAPAAREKAIVLARRLWWGVVAATVAIAAAGFALRPNMAVAFDASPWSYAFPVTALAGLLGVALCNAPETGMLAWLSSCAYLTGMLASVGFAAGAGPLWWVAGALLAAVYTVSLRLTPMALSLSASERISG